MAQSRRYLIRQLLLTIAVGAVFRAPLLGDASLEQPEHRTIQFSVMRIGRGDFKNIAVAPRYCDASELSFSRGRRSPTFTYQGPNPITFIRTDAAGEPTPIAQANIPDTVQHALLFFRPKPEPVPDNSWAYSIEVMDDSVQAFPNNSLILFNATGQQLQGKVEAHIHALALGPSQPIRLPGNARARATMISIAINTRDGPKLAFQNTLQFPHNHRHILMLAPPPRTGSLQISAYIIQQAIDTAQ